MSDIVILVADKSMEYALRGGLERPESLGIRPITLEFLQHPGRDGGARTTGASILALEKERHSHAMLVLDHEGCGDSDRTATELEGILNEELATTWSESAAAIVIEPELDVWMWGSDNVMAELLGWSQQESIRAWLTSKNFELMPNGKPVRPKEALEEICRVCRCPRSAANYQRIASKISLAKCEDASFHRLRDRLRLWFPPSI